MTNSPCVRAETGSRTLIIGTTALYCLLFFLIDHNFTISLTAADADIVLANVSSISGASAKRQIAFFVIGISGVLFLAKRNRLDYAVRRAPLVMAFLYVALAWLSCFWADDPRLVLKRVVSFSLSLLGAFALSRSIPKSRFVAILAAVSGVFLVLGVVAERLLGTFTPLAEGYRFMGTRGPEGQGFNCGILVLSSLAISDGKRNFTRFVFRLISVAGLLFLVLTRARGPFAGLVVALAAYHHLTRRRESTLSLAFVGVLIACFFVLLLGWSDFTSFMLMGRQEEANTLTGRTPLWDECLNYVAKRPLVGYGFSGFWTESRVMEFAESQGWINFNGHSIYLDTALSLGVVGLTLLLAILFSALRSGVRDVRSCPDTMRSVLVSVLLLICVDGLVSTVPIESAFSLFVLLAVVSYLCFSKPHSLDGSLIKPRMENSSARGDSSVRV